MTNHGLLQAVDVREQQFLAASDGIDFTFNRVKSVANMPFGGSGFFVDTFTATASGILFLHGYGNVFAVDLAAGFFASGGTLTFNRFTGPGQLALQSMYVHMPTEE
jgi:uncharacterized protein (AIM24 family)